MRNRGGTILVAAIAGLSWSALAIGPAQAAPTTQTFAYTGGEQNFVVPAGVCSVSIDARGAEGAANSATNSLGGSLPGLGGEAVGSVAVTPGETLTIAVGGQGAPGVNGSGPGAGGFNGGGAGGGTTGGLGTNPGSGGGGASGVSRSGSPLVIAGGGGGAGDSGTPGEALGGAGGGGTGGDGTGNLDGGNNSTGGTGGTQAGGGAAGINSGGATTAAPGNVGQGGAGGSAQQSGGGGGGGGYFGGGGGGGVIPNTGASAGGGGGSGFTPDGTGLTSGVQQGDGAIAITYEPTTETCSTPLAPVAVPVSPSFTG